MHKIAASLLGAVALVIALAVPATAASPTASTRLVTEGCSWSLYVDYSDFGPGDYFVAYETLSDGIGGSSAKFGLTGSGSFLVADGSLAGENGIRANVAVDPIEIDPSQRESFRQTGLGIDSAWFTSPDTTWDVSCVAPQAHAVPTPATTSSIDVPAHNPQSPLGLFVALAIGLCGMVVITRRAARTIR